MRCKDAREKIEKRHPEIGEKMMKLTPRKINIEPENDGLEDDFPFPGVYSQVPAVNLPGCILISRIFAISMCWARCWSQFL